MKRNKIIRSLGLPAAVLLCVLAAYLPAESGDWDIDVQLRNIYDDNILNYSDIDLDLIDDPSEPLNKFGIESGDDFILNPGLDIVYKTMFAGHSLHLGLKSDYYYYLQNDIKRYFRFETYFRKYFKKGSYFQGSFSYLPDYYYRNSFISGVGYKEAKFDKISVSAKLAVMLTREVQANGRYNYSNKDFIPIFDERDINEHEFEGELIYRPSRLWKGWASYAFCHAVSAGADNPDYVRDTSYDSNLFTLGSRFYLNGLHGRSFQIAGRISYKNVYYQTVKITPEDSFRLGRVDDRWYFYLMLDHEITSAFNIGLTYRHYLKNVDLPTEDLINNLESSSNSIYLIFNYSL